MPKLFKRSQRGDTIVEVMISMAILALVLGAAYATSTRSLRTGTDAGQRSQALSYAQQQVEILKTIGLKDPAQLATFKVAFPFCINPADGSRVAADVSTGVCSLPIGATDPDSILPYSVVNIYDPATETFKVTVKWQAGNTDASDNSSSLLYKPQDSFVEMLPADIGAPAPTESAPVAPNLPTIALLANPASVLSGRSVEISWTINKATTCSALTPSPNVSGWAGVIPVAANGTSLGSRTTSPFTADTTFSVRCNRTGAGDRDVSVVVGIERIVSFDPDSPGPLAYNTGTTLRWDTSYTTTCNINGVSVGAPDGQRATGNLTSTTTYTLTCNGPGGTNTASRTVTVGPPPPASYGPYSYGPSDYGPYSYGPSSYGPYSYGPSDYGPYSYGPSDYGPYSYGPYSYGPSDYGPYSYCGGCCVMNNKVPYFPAFGIVKPTFKPYFAMWC